MFFSDGFRIAVLIKICAVLEDWGECRAKLQDWDVLQGRVECFASISWVFGMCLELPV